MSNVALVPVPQEWNATLQNLIQLYTHDFSEHWAGTSQGDLQDDGRFADYPLDVYWREIDHVPLLIRQNSKIVGFVLINNGSHGGRPLDHNVAEFFIVRKYRRCGVGTEVAREIFSRYPGQCEVAVARKSIAALAFWSRAVREYPFVAEV